MWRGQGLSNEEDSIYFAVFWPSSQGVWLLADYIDGKLHVFDKDWPELPFAHREHIGCTVDYVAGRNRYMGYLISLGIYSFKGVKVGLD